MHKTDTIHGVRIESRYGEAERMLQLKNMIHELYALGLESALEALEYDSKNCIFDFIFKEGHPDFSSPNLQSIYGVAHRHLDQFDWGGVVHHGLKLE